MRKVLSFAKESDVFELLRGPRPFMLEYKLLYAEKSFVEFDVYAQKWVFFVLPNKRAVFCSQRL